MTARPDARNKKSQASLAKELTLKHQIFGWYQEIHIKNTPKASDV